MKRFQVFFIFVGILWSSRCLGAGAAEPKPIHPQLYTTVYEQQVLLQALQGKQQDALNLLLANAPGMNKGKEEVVRKELAAFLHKFQKKQQRYSDKVLLEKFYYAVHRKFLKEYQPYQPFHTLLSEGKYNCLTGTALYAYLLDGLGFQFQVYETDYHIFLRVQTAEGEEILIESTDPLYGFVEGAREMKARLEQIKQDALPTASEKNNSYYDFKLNILREISLTQLAGLQYFNQATALYNAQRITEAEMALSKGQLLYQAERFEHFAQLLVDVR